MTYSVAGIKNMKTTLHPRTSITSTKGIQGRRLGEGNAENKSEIMIIVQKMQYEGFT